MSILLENIDISGIEFASRVSGYPMNWNAVESEERLIKLGSAKSGSGHDVSLTGIVVRVDITADHSWWMQWMRYHFHQIVSSTSKMHSLTKMELQFHPKTHHEAISNFTKLRNDFQNGNVDFETLALSAPIGLMLKAATITNYLQLKTIWHQRKTHKMSSWVEYCKWIETLPLMNYFLK